jgi:hypothetical protein
MIFRNSSQSIFWAVKKYQKDDFVLFVLLQNSYEHLQKKFRGKKIF